MELPIERCKGKIIETVKSNPVTIIVGETGSGKTTQVPRYLYEVGFAGDGRIGITEPRRIAAISAAEFVAGQIGCKVGEKVGFQIRFNVTTSEGTEVKFMTDGILLQEAKSDPLFSRYKVLVFDEAHERGLNTDFAIGLVKRALKQRSDLKVVVMSATLEAEKFAKFFGGAPIITVKGRMYPVEERFMTEQDQQEAFILGMPKRAEQAVEILAAWTVGKIHRSGAPGDILVFMPGEAEIHRVMRHLESLNLSGLKVLAAYGNMSPDQQRRIFERVEGRKVVIATNIAETSITIDGVVHVVDSGLIKESCFDPKTGIGTLKVVEHSKAGLEQRKGRAGRTQSGVCWRLFTEDEYRTGRWNFQCEWNEKRPDYTKPEIQRSDLAGVVLRLAGIGIKDVEKFDFIDPPSFQMFNGAVKTLKAIGAITEERDVTEVGQKLLDMPLDPRIGKMIIEAVRFGCVKEIVAIAATLSVRDFFNRPNGKESDADVAKLQFVDNRSDLLTALAVMYAYEEHGWDRRWASENFLNWKAIEEALSIRSQVEDILEQLDVKLSSIGYYLPKDQLSLTEEEKKQGEAIGKAVLAGFVENLARFSYQYQHEFHRVAEEGGSFYIHPASVLFGDQDLRLFTAISIVETKKASARGCQVVEIEWIKELFPDLVKVERTEARMGCLMERYTVYEQVLFRGQLLEEKELPATEEEIARKLEKDRQEAARWDSARRLRYWGEDVFTKTVVQRAFPTLFSEIDAEVEKRINSLRAKADIIFRDPKMYGYDGGYGILRKTYKLTGRIDDIWNTYKRGEREEGEKLLIALEEELNIAFARAAEVEQKRLAKKAADDARREQEERAADERQKIEAERHDYQRKFREVQEKCQKYPGWKIYRFPVGPDGLPLDYKEDGRTLSFDQDFSDIWSETGKPCWGYITQWGNPAKVALVLEVVEEPKGKR